MSVDRFDAATDALTDALHDAELFFHQRNRFVSASVRISDDLTLSWAKNGGDWRLLIGVKTLDNANRIGRILAAGGLESLLQQLEMNERSLETDLAAAVRSATDFVSRHVDGSDVPRTETPLPEGGKAQKP